MSETAESGASGLKIGAIIKATGVTRATIHHYVKEGLLPEPVKTSRNDHKDKAKRKLAANTRNEASGYSGW